MQVRYTQSVYSLSGQLHLSPIFSTVSILPIKLTSRVLVEGKSSVCVICMKYWIYIYLSLPLFPFIMGDVLTATNSPPHLIVFFTLSCLLSSSSGIPPLLPSSYLSYHISLVSSWPPHVTMPLSSVVCHPPSFPHVLSSSLNSIILLLSALDTLAIFRTKLFSHNCSLCCGSFFYCQGFRFLQAHRCHTSAHDLVI